MLWTSAASARTERFRWTQTNASNVDYFMVYVGLASGSYSASMNVGIPTKDSTGAYYYDIVVKDTDTIYVVVTAWDATLESARSNEVSRAGITTGGGSTTTPPPTTPPPPATANAAVTGFALWNALTDTVVDATFQNGDTIPDAVRSCAAIEIKTNAYLSTAGTPGSIKKVFDGADKGCAAGGYENEPPYAWEDDAGPGKFPCAASLSAIGTHTLTVTPYDGDNCSGAVGTPASVTFTVSGPSSSGGSTVGAPGQPFIVQ
jgi:hypothetical protein